MENYNHLIIDDSYSLLRILQLMDKIGTKLLFVCDDNQFESVVSIGDVQRAIIKGVSLDSSIKGHLRKNNIIATPYDDIQKIKEEMRIQKIEFMPVVDEYGRITKVISWDDLFESELDAYKEKINIPVIIMAGGEGTRLRPLTHVVPKPLVPVGVKTILEVILDQFEEIGCNTFYMSVNYKADMIKYYMSQLSHKYNIEYVMESKPLGTIGSVSLLKGKITTPFFVSNCDSITDQDYRDVYEYHLNNRNDLTIVTMVKSFKIPYGVIETGEDGLMVNLKEKPEQTFQVNTGVYILNPECIDEIPEGEFFHITHLMEKIKNRGGRVGCFPVSEKSWKDMGEWPEYLKMINVK